MASGESGDFTEENLVRQGEEIEILRSMYDKDFQIEDETPTFSVMVHLGDKEGEEATLVVSYNLDYPATAPPIYHLSIPWLPAEQKETICKTLDELYLSHMGEPIVYYWVEKLRELLLEMRPEKLDPISYKLIDPVMCGSNSQIEDGDETYEWTEQVDHSCWQNKSDPKVKSYNVDTSLPVIFTGDPLTDRKSTFQAHLAKIISVEQMKLVLEELYKNKKIASATHNMYAYRIFKDEQANAIQDCEDDGETHAGSRLLHLLQILDCRNVLVVVTRWYGGIQLHGDRFKHINNVARILLEKHGFINKACSTKKK